MTNRNQRRDQYLSPKSGLGHVANDLVLSARRALADSLNDRCLNYVRLPQNHHSPSAAGAIVLVVTALDASINEAIAMTSVFGGGIDKSLALLSTQEKLDQMATGAEGLAGIQHDLQLVVALRHELVHFLPRQVTSDAGNVPGWFGPLQKRGLFIDAPHSDFQFCQKLTSYALAYWCWDVSFAALKLIIESLPPVGRNVCDYLLHNFGMYSESCPPCDLPEFDAANALAVTRFDPLPV